MNTQMRKILLTIFLVGSVSTIYAITLMEELVWNPDSKGPYVLLGEDPSNQLHILWETPIAENSMIRYGITASNLNNTVQNLTESTFHHIELNGLESNTKYYYQVGSSTAEFLPNTHQ